MLTGQIGNCVTILLTVRNIVAIGISMVDDLSGNVLIRHLPRDSRGIGHVSLDRGRYNIVAVAKLEPILDMSLRQQAFICRGSAAFVELICHSKGVRLLLYGIRTVEVPCVSSVGRLVCVPCCTISFVDAVTKATVPMIRPINLIEVELHILVIVVTNQSIEVFCNINVRIVTGIARGSRQLTRGDIYVTDGEPPVAVLLPSRSVPMHLDVNVNTSGLRGLLADSDIDVLVGVPVGLMSNGVCIASLCIIVDGQPNRLTAFFGDPCITSFIIFPVSIIGAVTCLDPPDVIIQPVTKRSLNRNRFSRRNGDVLIVRSIRIYHGQSGRRARQLLLQGTHLIATRRFLAIGQLHTFASTILGLTFALVHLPRRLIGRVFGCVI